MGGGGGSHTEEGCDRDVGRERWFAWIAPGIGGLLMSSMFFR